ncbi:hypothetical protein GGF32_001674, partial [Allomyces javanicus]
TFGRGNSKDGDFAENIIVMSDVFMTVSQFPQKFKEYATKGIVRDVAQGAAAARAENDGGAFVPALVDGFDNVEVDSAPVPLEF